MLRRNKKLTGSLFILAAALVCLPFIFAAPQKRSTKPAPSVVNAQIVESKLARKADFVPSHKATLDRLVAIAQHYELPMGIEWVEGVGSQELEVPISAVPAKPTVRDLLAAIVSRLPDYQMNVENGVVHIAPPVIAARRDNVLNLMIEDFQVNNDTLFGAQHYLRVAIDMTLNPEEEGYVGGYGHAPDHVFAKRLFSYKSNDATVRQILDGLIMANGNALWIAELDREAGPTSTPPGEGKGKSEANQTLKLEWRFVPLSEK